MQAQFKYYKYNSPIKRKVFFKKRVGKRTWKEDENQTLQFKLSNYLYQGCEMIFTKKPEKFAVVH